MADGSRVTIAHDELMMGPVRVSFQRTLRLPESGVHDLPPGLGAFPLRRVQDYPHTAPAEWAVRGGVMLPVYQREAMWLSLHSAEPAALQVGVGTVCAVSGERWSEQLTQSPQNYVPLPEQPWLDGINSGEGVVRQFVAVPLGLGATVEAQVTGEEWHGGIQLRAVGLTEEARRARHARRQCDGFDGVFSAPLGAEMGLGAGGTMRQEVYADERPAAHYDEHRSWRVFVHLCSAAQWTAITGEAPPPTPVDREAYVRCGLPWYDYYDADRDDLAAGRSLATVRTVGDVLGDDDEPFTSVSPQSVITLKDAGGDAVTDGSW